jgi:transposase InsO family protein
MGLLQHSNNCKNIFTIIDRTSKWMEAIPLLLPSLPQLTVHAPFVIHWITRFGVPTTITSDRGPQLTSSLWAALCKMLSISHCQTKAYHPEANCAVERLHSHLKEALHARATRAAWTDEMP